MNPESFKQESEQKLYIVRDIEGEPNREELEVVREFENKLSDNPRFIGIAPFGSVVSGYSNESSDIDLYLLYDSSFDSSKKGDKEKEDLYYQRLSDKSKELTEKFKKDGIKLNTIITMIDAKAIAYEIGYCFENNQDVFPEMKLAEMSRIVTGKKIEGYRKIIAEELQKLTPDQQNTIIEKIVNSLYRREELSLHKRRERLQQLPEEDHNKILEKRKEMWQKRVKIIWKLT